MAKTKHSIFLLMYLMACGAAGTLADDAQGIDVTGLYKIRANTSLLGLEGADVIGALAGSPSNMVQAAESVYGEAATHTVQLRYWTEMEGVDSDSFMLSLRFGPLPEGQTRQLQFLEHVAKNLHEAMLGVYADTRDQLREELVTAREREAEAKAKLAALSAPPSQSQSLPALDQRVDLSTWDRYWTFRAAVQFLRQFVESVENPAGLTVLWRELAEEGLDADDETGLDGLGQVRLATGLDLLLRSLSAGRDAKLGYTIQDGLIVIAVAQDTPGHASPLGESAKDLASRRKELDRERAEVEMELSQQNALGQAIEEQIAHMRAQMEDQVSQDTVNRELEALLLALQQRHKSLEKEFVQQRRKSLEKEFDSGIASDDDLIRVLQQLTETRIKIAERHMNLVQQHGGDLLQDLSGRLVEMTIGRAEHEAKLRGLTKQIRAIDARLTSASQYEVFQISLDLVRASLKDAMMEVHKLTQQYERLSPPSISLVKAGR